MTGFYVNQLMLGQVFPFLNEIYIFLYIKQFDLERYQTLDYQIKYHIMFWQIDL